MSAIPVTLLSGSLGAGKTTLLNGLLERAGDRNVAVLVNDMGEINVDADLVSRTETAAEGRVAELSNGCICCELRDDLETAVVRLAERRDFSHLVVEPSGISEPRPVADLFERGSSAAARYDVDSVVTVVDARQFHDALDERRVDDRAPADAASEGETDGDADDPRPLSDLLAEQVEFADVVVVNKTDLVDDAELARVREMVAALRPDAEVVETTFSAVDPDVVFDRGLFDPADDGAGWRRVAAGREDDGHDHAHDHGDGDGDGHGHGHAYPEDEYGMTSFVYRRRRPFHPGRFADLLGDLPGSVVRSKGTCWVAGRDDRPIRYSQAGPSVRVEASGRWIASLPEADQDLYRANRSDLDWDETVGDRQTELVFIGRGLDEAALVDRLDGCLVADDDPLGASPDGAANPFPAADGETAVLAEPD